MSSTLWIVLASAAVVVFYLFAMRVFYRRSQELDKQVDHSKIKEWKDEED